MSLRRVTKEAGLDKPPDEATLAARGIRKLRTENVLKKGLLMESKGRVKELMHAHHGMGRRGKRTKGKAGFLEGKK